MDENLHHIEDLFYSALANNEELASDEVWEAIDKRLDKDKIIRIKRSYVHVKRLVILLLFLLASHVLYDVYTITKGVNSKAVVLSNKPTDANSDRKAEITKIKTNNEIFISPLLHAGHTSVQPDLTTINKNEALSNPIHLLSNQHRATFINADNENLKIFAVNNFNLQKKRSADSIGTIRTTSGNAIEQENNTLNKRKDQGFNPNFGLKKLKMSVMEHLLILPSHSFTVKQLSQYQAILKVATINTLHPLVVNKNKGTKYSGFSVTPIFSPDIAWYHLQDYPLSNQQDNAQELEKEEKHEFSSTYGILIDYTINRHWGLQSGLTLSNTNIVVEPKIIYAQQDNRGTVKYRISTSSGYGYILPSFSNNPSVGDSLHTFTSNHSLQYIGIPLAATFHITKGKIRLNALAGIAVNILTKAKLETTVEKGFDNASETVKNLEGLRNGYFSGLAGMGFDYRLTKKTAITFAPTIRFALNSINKDATVKSYPMSFGFAIGLKWDL